MAKKPEFIWDGNSDIVSNAHWITDGHTIIKKGVYQPSMQVTVKMKRAEDTVEVNGLYVDWKVVSGKAHWGHFKDAGAMDEEIQSMLARMFGLPDWNAVEPLKDTGLHTASGDRIMIGSEQDDFEAGVWRRMIVVIPAHCWEVIVCKGWHPAQRSRDFIVGDKSMTEPGNVTFAFMRIRGEELCVDTGGVRELADILTRNKEKFQAAVREAA